MGVYSDTTQLDIELSCVAIDTSPTQINSTRRRVELYRYRRVSTATQLNSTDPVEERTAKSVVFYDVTTYKLSQLSCVAIDTSPTQLNSTRRRVVSL